MTNLTVDNINPDDIAGKECMHITYTPSRDGKDDALIIKEYIHLKSGEIIPNLKILENQDRSFWVTKTGRRDHIDKLQWEKIEDTTEHRCRQVDLIRKADLALGNSGYCPTTRLLFKSPYLYGCGVKPQCNIKYAYLNTYPDTKSRLARVGVIDTETDVLNGTGEIIIGAFSYKNRAILTATRDFFGNTPDDVIERKLRETVELHLGDVMRKRGIKLEIQLEDNAGGCTKAMIDKGHEWEPDFISFWNMDFDITKMTEALTKYHYNLDQVFSDPRVPDKYKFFKYRQGKSIKITHDGKATSINPEQRWHVAECPASFFFIDGMTLYYRLRMAAGMEEGYSLEAVLNRNLDIGKMGIDETAHLTGIDLHKEMQTNYKYEYAAYCLFDSISTELLDEETGDVAVKLPAMCKYSDFTDFKSGPTRIADELHFHCLENGHVVGVTDGDIRDDNDQYVLKSVDWIITLPAYMGHNLGIDFLEYEQ